MDGERIRTLSGGVNQRGLRNFNERLLLSMLQRHGPLPGSDLARQTGLSPQTVSVILRRLEKDGVVARGPSQKGRVGKPSVPMDLAASGALSFGLKIGRRSSDLLLGDLRGVVRQQVRTTYRYPMPNTIFGFLKDGIQRLSEALPPEELCRICGIGVAAPSEIWNWPETTGAPAQEFGQWKDIDFKEAIAAFSTLPVYVTNDATAACRSEQVYGRGKEFLDYAYFFVGSFVGGGIVLNQTVIQGNRGNAGALGSLRTTGTDGKDRQLIETASLCRLEAAMVEAGIDPKCLWTTPQDWSGFPVQLDAWITAAATELAKASLQICAVIDFEAILIDGAFPPEIRTRLVQQIREKIGDFDWRGITQPSIEEARVGGNARALGAACTPMFAQFFLDTTTGLHAS